MSAPYDPNQGYYPQQGGYPPQGYPPPGQGYPPPQPMQYQQAPPPQEEKSHGLSPRSAAVGSAERHASAVLSASTAVVN
ncbi:hypothetical protein ACJZ2D_004062 [Fusarium nematophilum]